MHAATALIFIAALAVGVVVAFAAAIGEPRDALATSSARLRRGVAVIAVATLVAVLAGGWIVAGNPVERVEHGWNTFKGGYAADRATGSRLTSGFGSDRYDFYRVALNEFVAHPLVGIGADNFQQQYLAARSTAARRLITRTASSCARSHRPGIIGALLARHRPTRSAARRRPCRAVACARRADPLAASVAAAALAGFAYWLVHGSFDWFWEFAGLGAPAFALLGIGLCAGAAHGAPSRRTRCRRLSVGARRRAHGAGAPLGGSAVAGRRCSRPLRCSRSPRRPR